MNITDQEILHCVDGNGRNYYFAYVIARGKNWFFNLIPSRELYVVYSNLITYDNNGMPGELVPVHFTENIFNLCQRYGTDYRTIDEAKYALSTAIKAFDFDNKQRQISVVETIKL